MEATQISIQAAAHEVAEALRELCRSQVEVWQDVPYWAHKANGRRGWSSVYKVAYQKGYWDIFGNGRGTFCPIVDLATGEMLYHDVPAKDVDVFRLAFNPDLIDATEIVSRLMKASVLPGPANMAETKGPPPRRPFTR